MSKNLSMQMKWLKSIGIDTLLYEFASDMQKKNHQKLKKLKVGDSLNSVSAKINKEHNISNICDLNANTEKKVGKEKILSKSFVSKSLDKSITLSKNESKEETIVMPDSCIDNVKQKSIIDSINSLEDLYKAILNIDCDLKHACKNTVICDGVKENVKVMLIGEAPGQMEDLHGIPFCGESGQLLDNMLDAIDLTRKKNVYITNAFFWRPPANRTPTKEEILSCRAFVEKHIALVCPKILVLVGATAAKSVLGDMSKPMWAMRSKFFLYKNSYLDSFIKTTCIFHPAYLLRQPTKKQDSWVDLLKIKHELKRC